MRKYCLLDANGTNQMEKIPEEGFKIIGLDVVGIEMIT